MQIADEELPNEIWNIVSGKKTNDDKERYQMLSEFDRVLPLWIKHANPHHISVLPSGRLPR